MSVWNVLPGIKGLPNSITPIAHVDHPNSFQESNSTRADAIAKLKVEYFQRHSGLMLKGSIALLFDYYTEVMTLRVMKVFCPE